MRLCAARSIALFLLCPAFNPFFLVAQDEPATSTTYAQIVRVSLLEGDVRVARGAAGRRAKDSGWEKAVVDLPLETGFSLVTGGDGRVEIEFEDASTAYLAPNSVLAFNELSSTGGVPHTELALLSGTMTLDLKPMAPAESYSVRTPGNGFSVRYPEHVYMRAGSYLDAMTLTSLRPTVFHVGGDASSLPAAQGTTLTFERGKAPVQAPEDKAQFAAWDEWVGRRVVERDQAMQATMQQAGLKAPIPGLAELRGQGTFFDCAPYGTCWEPNSPSSFQAPGASAQPVLDKAEDPAVTAALARQTVSVGQLRQGGQQVGNAQAGGTSGQTGPYGIDPYDFPCSPLSSRYRRDPVTGRLLLNPYPYSWAVCHTGSWIPRGRRYAWVVGIERHHHHPYHWVQTGRTVGYVPIHPKDVAGKPPVNLQNGLLHPDLSRRDGSGGVERIAYDGGQKVKLLDEAPRAFRNEAPPALARADEPRAVAYRLADRAGQASETGSRIALARPAGVPVTFDRKSQSFMIAQTVERGGVARTVAEPIGGRGNSLQMHSGSSGGGYSGGGSVSRGSGSSGGASSFSGGASHAGAPSASVSSAPAMSTSSGGSASAASSGGGRH